MDTGKGNLAKISEDRKNEIEQLIRDSLLHGKKTLKGSGIFSIDEVIELKGSKFKIVNITAHKLSLKILSR